MCPQTTRLPYADGTIQAPGQNILGDSPRQGDRRPHDSPTPRELIPQETYKPPRQQKDSGGVQTIEFSVRGEKGIRLSDALEGRWAGFDCQDDRPSFGDNRLSIMLRLRVRLSATARTEHGN